MLAKKNQNKHSILNLSFVQMCFHIKRIYLSNDLVFEKKGVGTGNDFYGWEFHKYTKIAYGTIVTEEVRWENPAPTRDHSYITSSHFLYF